MTIQYVRNVGRKLLRERFGDGVWRTAADMAYVLQKYVSNDAAARLAVKVRPRLELKSLDERILIGLRMMIQSTAHGMVDAKPIAHAESRVNQETGETEYLFHSATALVERQQNYTEALKGTVLPKPPTSGGKAVASDLDKATILGLARQTVLADVQHHPNSSPEDVASRLGHLLNLEAVRIWYKETNTKKTRDRESDPGKLSDSALKRWACNRLMHELKANGYLVADKVVRFRFQRGLLRRGKPRRDKRWSGKPAGDKEGDGGGQA